MPKLVFKLSEKQSLDFPLAGEHVRLGRNAANDIVIDNSWISSFHAEFRLGADGVIEIRDLNSSNGTLVNGKRIESARLKPGDTVVFGQLEAIFDPPPENAGLNGASSRGMTPPSPNAVPTASMRAPRMEAPDISGNARTEPVSPLSRHGVTEPLPAADRPNRLVVPTPVPPTMPVPSGEGGALTDNRRELQQTQSQIAAARSEMKALSEALETLRHDRESEEQNQAQLKLQGEREARELRTRLDKLQEEIEKTESAAAEMVQTRSGTMAQEEKELTARLAGLRSAEESAAASVKAQEEKLAALRNEESGFTAISAKLQAALQEVDEVAQRKTAAMAEAAAAESKAVAAQETLSRIQAEVEAAGTQQAEKDAAIATAVGLMKAREAELSELTRKIEESRRAVEASNESLAAREKALAEFAASHAETSAGLQALADRRTALEHEVEATQTRLAEQNAQLKAAGDKLVELDTAKARLLEIESAIAESTVRAVTAKEAAEKEVSRKAEALKTLAAAEEEQKQQDAALAGVKDELAVMQSKRESALAELAKVTNSVETANAAAKEAATRLSGMEQSIANAGERQALSQSSLTELTGQIEKAVEALSLKQAALTEIETQVKAAESSAKNALEARTLAARAAEELAENQRKLSTIINEVSGMDEKRASAIRALEQSRAELASLTEQINAARTQAALAAEKRAEVTSLQEQADELRTAVSRLEERRETFTEAPDPTWGTVHAMAKGIIKQIDLLDDLLTHLKAHNGSREAIEQMSIFRAGLMDILTEYTVESYRFEPGFTVDVAARKKIQIVESEEDSGRGTRIVKTYRPGYVCSNGSVGVQTLLRKAEVSILLGR